MVSVFAEINFFFDRDRGWSNLFHTVGSVSIKIRKTQKPSVIELNLMRGPRVQRKIFDHFIVNTSVYFHYNKEEKYRQQKIRKNLQILKQVAEAVKRGYNKGHDMNTALKGSIISKKVSGNVESGVYR